MKPGKTLIVMALGAIILGGATQALAWGHGRGGGHWNGGGNGHYAECPGAGCTWGGHYGGGNAPALDPEKQQELRSLTRQHQDSLEPKRQELYAKRLELEALGGNPSARPEDISRLSKDVARLQSELNKARRDFRDKLTEQYGDAFPRGGGRGHRGGCGC